MQYTKLMELQIPAKQIGGSYNNMLTFTDFGDFGNFKTTQQQQQKDEQPHPPRRCPEQRIATAVRSFCAAGTDEWTLLADDLGCCGFGRRSLFRFAVK
jgi:hypothetical protein